MEDAAMNDASLGDGAMIDANMDGNLDDLFGEAADGIAAEALGVALPSASLPPGLVLRVMDMQTRGCCTQLAYANTGSIAQIPDDGRKVIFRTLIRSMKTGTWSLTEESMYPILAPEGTTFEHLQFSGIGIDLAVVDNHGSVHVHTLVGALGKMPLAPSSIQPTENPRSDFDAVVGLHWLPVFPNEFKIPYITPALKMGETWQTQMRQPSASASETSVRHAVDGRHALLCVSRDAKLTLMYQNEMLWQATSTRLENITSSHELLSHAAMGEEADHVLLVTHDLGGRFRLYKISITWNPTQQTRQGGPPFTLVAPTFEIGHLTVFEHVGPQQADVARLSDLQLIPRIPSIAAEPTSPSFPTVLAVFTRATLSVDRTQQHQEAFSVIARWHVETVVPTLHESFAKLKSNGTTPMQNPVTLLRRQEDIVTNKLVLSVVPQYFSTVLAFAGSDGSIEFRDRVTMTSIEPYGDTTTISSLPQAGFEQMMTEHNIHVAMSADGSTLAAIKTDGSISQKNMTLRYSWQPLDDGISDTHGLIEASIICLARQYAILSCSSIGNDETLALLPYDLSSELRALFIKEIIKMTGRTLDISMWDLNRQQNAVIREPLIPRALSAQYVTGTVPGSMKRDFAGNFAYAYLNLRMTGISIAQFLSRPDVVGRPDVLISLRGNIKWGSDLLIYITNVLISFKRDLDRRPSGPDYSTQAVADYIAKAQSPVLHMLLSTFSRSYVRFLSSCIPKYLGAVQKFVPNARSVQDRQQLEETFQRGTTLPFKFAAFEQFVGEIDAAIRNAYTTGSVPSERRSEIELNAMTESSIPEDLGPAIQNLFESALPKFMDNADRAKLYFWDTTWLGIEGGVSEVREYDVVRKIPLLKGTKLRKCRRCPAVMEDVTPEKMREMPGWLGHTQRHCVCGNYWIVG